MELLEMLARPDKAYTAIPFWFLNGDLRHAEIRRQLMDFQAHGIHGVVLHPRMGLSRRIGYLSPVFFRYLRTAVETAAQLDMRVVLYDEGMYPSGSAGGQVVAGHPELRSRGLALVSAPQPGDHILCETDQGVLVERFSGGTIRGVHLGEDDGEPGAPLSADILNPEAVKRFIALTHEAYARELGGYFGTTIIGMFTDEPSILGRNTRGLQPWSRDFDQLFEAEGGDLRGLTGLFDGHENSDTELYRRLILRRECEVYYAALSAWCQAHGIGLMGHPHQSDDIEVQRYFHVPGQDLVFRMVAPEKGGITGMDSTMAKCSADMARLMGRSRNSNECFGASNRAGNPWHLTGGDLKWMIDYLTVRGVNLLIPHAFYYSLAGSRSQERPPDVGPGSLWWPYYRLWADYMARMSCLAAEAEPILNIAVLCRNRELCPETVAPLFESQRGFQYIPESFWPQCVEENGQLVCGGRRYQAVLGPAERFPSVPHIADAVAPDCRCVPPQPGLRTARLRLRGRDLWLLVNEGMSEVEAELILPTRQAVGRYDLWAGTACRAEGSLQPDGQHLALRLGVYESALLFACDEAEWAALPAPLPPAAVILRTADFTLAEEKPAQLQRIYTAHLTGCPGDVLIEAKIQELGEAEVNGKPAGVSFWPGQGIRIPTEMLGPGDNVVRLTVTGSLANRYGRPVPYGVGLPEDALPGRGA